MSNDMDAAFSSLSDQTKKMNIALHYAHNDMDRAKQMVTGKYKDLLAIKVSFSSSSLYGAMLIFLNSIYNKIMDMMVIVTTDYSIESISTMDEWNIFESDLLKENEKNVHDAVLSKTMADGVINQFTYNFINDFKILTENKEEIKINHLWKRLIQDVLSLQRLSISVDNQIITSLDMELLSVSSQKLSSFEIVKSGEKGNQVANEESKKEEEESATDKEEIKLIMNSSLILDPIKGKDISTLDPGDKIMLNIIDKNFKTISVAKAFGAYNEENDLIKPIPGRIKTIKYVDNVGYKIYAIVAKGIFVNIVEEENDIKVKMDPNFILLNNQEDGKGKLKSLSFIIIAVVFLCLTGLLLVIIL